MLKPKPPQTSFFMSGSYLYDRIVPADHLSGKLTKWVPFSALWYGDCRNSTGNLGTDKLFTGQRLDGTDLYYFRKPSVGPANINTGIVNSPLTISALWSGRYYDPTIGRFISPDTIVSYLSNPQSLNRYSYALNRPLVGPDIDGHFLPIIIAAIWANPFVRGAIVGAVSYAVTQLAVTAATAHEQGTKSFTERWDWGDFGEAVALGAATGGLGAWGVVTKTLGVDAPVVVGAIGSEAQYLVNVAEGQTQLSAAGAMRAALLGGISGSVEIGFPGNTSLEAAGVGVVSATGSGVLGEIMPVEASTSYYDYDYYDYANYDYSYDYSGYDYGYSDYSYDYYY